MRSQTVTNVLLLVIAALLFGLWIQNMQRGQLQEVVIYQNGRPVGSGVMPTRSNALPVRIVD